MAAREDDGRKHHIGIRQGEVGRYALLPGDPDRVELIASRFDNPKFLMRRREYTTWTGELDGVPVACTSTGIGCPSTAIAVEELRDLGRLRRSSTDRRIAGVAGGLYGHSILTIAPTGFDFMKSIEIVVMVILGGMGSLRGVVVGAFTIEYLSQTLLPFLGSFINPPIQAIGLARQLEKHGLFFLEDPFAPEDVGYHALLR